MSTLLRIRFASLFAAAALLAVGGPAGSATAAAASPATAASQDSKGYVWSGGLLRSYDVHLPAGHSSLSGLPVMLVLHGHWQTNEGMAQLTHMNRVADENGFAVVYPVSVGLGWSDSRDATLASKLGIDDAEFMRTLVDKLTRQERADASRVYAIGMSNGGIMTQYLGCRLADRLAGIASVTGQMPVATAPTCRPSRPLPVMLVGGTADPLIPYDGGGSGVGGKEAPVLSFADTAAKWRAVNRCSGTRKSQLPAAAGDPTSVTVAEATECHGRTQVKTYTVTGGGHTWPGGKQYLPTWLVGPTTSAFDASEAAWDFFESHAAG
ncbi:alpha/beta hydrolase family esterase [Streptomyces sp. NPDC127084]|uniref:extracellular catalytic domain type 1 short-chain-length polyhydroxyalkanoate depolymerase n=1 Tax=Streptomyces sp. NPDC127084 TaxID=3347133 RepID=UPI00366405BA